MLLFGTLRYLNWFLLDGSHAEIVARGCREKEIDTFKQGCKHFGQGSNERFVGSACTCATHNCNNIVYKYEPLDCQECVGKLPSYLGVADKEEFEKFFEGFSIVDKICPDSKNIGTTKTCEPGSVCAYMGLQSKGTFQSKNCFPCPFNLNFITILKWFYPNYIYIKWGETRRKIWIKLFSTAKQSSKT